ncbi:hypothetical protein LEP3755_49840 [Leptolyngbya sp. NIES-3755]|nr:hypothetical protein LEP3755_49840 [Leptolyngbya sp. NIES-3755]
MDKYLKSFLTVCVAFLFVFCVFVAPSYAANRTGSHRVGGTNSHGKGSHYVGGHFIEQPSTELTKSSHLCINVQKSAHCMN